MSSAYHTPQQRPHLIGLQGGRVEDNTQAQGPARSSQRGNFLPPLALATTVAALAGSVALGGAVKLAESVFSGSGQSGLSAEQLQHSPYKVTIIPATQEAAQQGASAIGELADSQVYEGKNSSTTTTNNLNAVISYQHQGGLERIGQTYTVPVLDPKDFAARQAAHLNPSFVIGPIERSK